jgi:hypothetical protein
MKNKCLYCGGKVVKRKINYIFLGQNLGKFEAEVCTKCGEQVFSEETAERISDIARVC